VKKDTIYLTNQGIKNLTDEKNEIANLLNDSTQAILIDDKERQFLMDRLTFLQQAIEETEAIPVGSDPELVQLGTIVQLYDLVSDEMLEYKLVDHLEANPIDKKLAVQSPIGQNLLSKRVGDVVTLTIGKEVLSFVIKKVSQISNL
jgi:transcription elongation factor GreA